MPTKNLDTPFNRDGLTQRAFIFGGGADSVFTASTDANGVMFTIGYNIDTGGGNDSIFGSTQDDTLTGGDGSDLVVGGLGNDIIRGGNTDGADSSKGQQSAPANQLTGDDEEVDLVADQSYVGGNDTIVGGNGSTNNMYGDARLTVTFSSNASFTGGNDMLTGGDSTVDATAFNNMYGDASSIFFSSASGANGESFTGGNDTLIGGDGATNTLFGDIFSLSNDGTFLGGDDTLIGGNNGATNAMTGDIASAGGVLGSVTGGSDTLISGTNANDTMTGDFNPDDSDLAGAIGGVDTFVFATSNGQDTIRDFEAGKDKINLSGTEVVLSALDNDDSGVADGFINGDDDFVMIVGSDMVIDLGAAAGGTAGIDILTIEGETQLATSDFDFLPLV